MAGTTFMPQSSSLTNIAFLCFRFSKVSNTISTYTRHLSTKLERNKLSLMSPGTKLNVAEVPIVEKRRNIARTLQPEWPRRIYLKVYHWSWSMALEVESASIIMPCHRWWIHGRSLDSGLIENYKLGFINLTNPDLALSKCVVCDIRGLYTR